MHGLVITYSSIFKEEAPDLDTLVGNIPSKIALQYLSLLNATLHHNATDKELQKFIVLDMTKNQDPLVRRILLSKLTTLSSKGPAILVDTYTVMELMNRVLLNYNGDEAKDTTPFDEINLLMAILIVNEKYNLGPTIHEGANLFEIYCAYAWPALIFSTELRLKKDAFFEVFRGIKFALHLEANPRYQALFKNLFDQENEPFFKYASNIFFLYGKIGFRQDLGTMSCMFSYNIEEVYSYTCPWIYDLTQTNPNNHKSTDYRSLRSYPILKLYDNSYSIVNWNFILDKMYNGLIFDLHEKSGVLDQSSPVYNTAPTDLPGFKSALSGGFSEEFCLNILMSALNGYVIRRGKDESIDNQDYYIRRGNKIALIEHKDPLFVKDANYARIKATIDNKLIEEKGVAQIIKLIEKLNNNPTAFEPEIAQHTNPNQLVVYPILLVTDSAFALTGMEDYVNHQFRNKIKELGDLTCYVNNLVIIDLYSLLNMHDALAQDKAEFFNLLDQFFSQKRTLKKNSRKKGATAETISAQFKGFSEVIGYNMRPIKHNRKDPRTLFYKMIAELETLGFPVS